MMTRCAFWMHLSTAWTSQGFAAATGGWSKNSGLDKVVQDCWLRLPEGSDGTMLIF